MARISLSPPRTPLFRIVDWYCRRLYGDMLDPGRALAHHVHYVPLRAMTPPGADNLVAAGRCVAPARSVCTISTWASCASAWPRMWAKHHDPHRGREADAGRREGAAVVTRVPAVTDLDQDPCLLIRTGDWVRVDATRGLIEVKPRPRTP